MNHRMVKGLVSTLLAVVAGTLSTQASAQRPDTLRDILYSHKNNKYMYDRNTNQSRPVINAHVAFFCGLRGGGGVQHSNPKNLWDGAQGLNTLTADGPPEGWNVGPPVTTEEECVIARGVVKPAPEWTGKVVHLKNTPHVAMVDNMGMRRTIPNAAVYKECGLMPANEHVLDSPIFFAIQKGADLNAAECKTLRANFSGTLPDNALTKKLIRGGASDTVFLVDTSLEKRAVDALTATECLLDLSKAQMLSPQQFNAHKLGAPLNGDTCRALMGLEAMPMAGSLIATCDSLNNHYVFGRDRKLHWISNKDNWLVFNACKNDRYRDEKAQCVHEAYVKSLPMGAPADANQCRSERGLPPVETLAQKFNGKFIANCDSFKNTHVVANGKRHWIGNKDNWKVFEGCRAAPTEDIQCMSLNEVNTVPDGGPIGDINQCRSLRGLAPLPPPPPPPPTVAQKFEGQFIANCDAWKHTHLVANGKRHWISNKDNWNTFNNCKKAANEDVQCMSLADVNSVPDGGAIDLNTCRSMRGLPALPVAAPPPPPPPPPTIAQRFNDKFIAYCDKFKNTFLVANGRRYWVSNKDSWGTFNGCKRYPTEDVNCMSQGDVGSVPDGGAADLATCRRLRGL